MFTLKGNPIIPYLPQRQALPAIYYRFFVSFKRNEVCDVCVSQLVNDGMEYVRCLFIKGRNDGNQRQVSCEE
jgi:hypothetical protein